MIHPQILQHPHLSEHDIRRLVKREYYSSETEVLSLLERINSPEKPRVQAAILKISEGNISKLRATVQTALTDYSSIVFMAEFPNFYHIENITPQKREEAITKDWFAYNRWLKK